MVNYFELYGLPVSFAPDAVAVKNKFYELSRTYHPDRFTLTDAAKQAEALQMSSANNEAYKTLKDADLTMGYILKQHEVLEEEEKYNLPSAFLMEMMDLNEALSDYEIDDTQTSQYDNAKSILDEHLQAWQQETNPLTTAYDNGNHSQKLLLQIKEQYFRKKYLLRIQERMNSFATR